MHISHFAGLCPMLTAESSAGPLSACFTCHPRSVTSALARVMTRLHSVSCAVAILAGYLFSTRRNIPRLALQTVLKVHVGTM